MKRYKQKLVWIVGTLIVIVLLVVVQCTTYENKAKENVKNCEKINHDMTINQVVRIMGKPNNIKTYQGKINYKDMEVTKYYYNAPSGSSVGVNIYFEAQSKKVVRMECKD